MIVPGDRIRIINFHGIGTPSRSLEPGEDRYWLSVDRFIAVIDRIAARPSVQDICITFDDGNISDLEIAAPVLASRGLSAQFFVLAGRIGSWGSLGTTDIRSLLAMGMSIGSHGMDHVNWTRLGVEALDRELKHSMNILGDIIGDKVSAASIPFGRYNATVLRALRNAGYLHVYSSDNGATALDDFPRSRTSVTRTMSDRQIDDLLAGRMPSWKRMRRWGGVLVKSHF